MRVDFYQLSQDPVERVLPSLAQRTLDLGKRMLIVAEDADLRQRISAALWRHSPASFLAHGEANEPKAAHQPILLSGTLDPINGAVFVALADGIWRDPGDSACERMFLLFGEAALESARASWKALGGQDGMTRHFWRHQGGKWTEMV